MPGSRDLPRLTALALVPLLWPQGLVTLARVPRLDEAGGPRTGSVTPRVTPGGGGPDADGSLVLGVIGESTAVGVGVDRLEDGIAAGLARRLAEGSGVPVLWHVVGRNGARLRANRRRLLPDVRGAGPVDVWVVLLGVNDALGLTSVGRWRTELDRLLVLLRGDLREGGVVVLAGVPRIEEFPALPQPLRAVLGRHARALDDTMRDCADATPHVVHVPTPGMEGADDLSPDGFHPSARGYARWADVLTDTAVLPWWRQHGGDARACDPPGAADLRQEGPESPRAVRPRRGA